MARQKRATDELNIALSGVEAALATIETFPDLSPKVKQALTVGKGYCEQARQALLTIQFHAAQI